MTMKQTTLPDPNGPALVVPAWASDATKQLGSEVAELFDATRAAREESERLRLAVGDVDPMTTSIDDLIGAGGMARQSQLEALRDELLARSKFAEYLAALEVDRRQTETESLRQIETARSEAKAAIVGAGYPNLYEAIDHRGKPDETRRAAFNEVLNSYPAVGAAADTYREARSMGTSLASRDQDNARHRSEAETSLRKMLGALAAVAVG